MPWPRFNPVQPKGDPEPVQGPAAALQGREGVPPELRQRAATARPARPPPLPHHRRQLGPERGQLRRGLVRPLQDHRAHLARAQNPGKSAYLMIGMFIVQNVNWRTSCISSLKGGRLQCDHWRVRILHEAFHGYQVGAPEGRRQLCASNRGLINFSSYDFTRPLSTREDFPSGFESSTSSRRSGWPRPPTTCLNPFCRSVSRCRETRIVQSDSTKFHLKVNFRRLFTSTTLSRSSIST